MNRIDSMESPRSKLLQYQNGCRWKRIKRTESVLAGIKLAKDSGLFLFDTRELTAESNQFRVKHVPRNCNTVAHIMAKVDFSYSDYQAWLEDQDPLMKLYTCSPVTISGLVYYIYIIFVIKKKYLVWWLSYMFNTSLLSVDYLFSFILILIIPVVVFYHKWVNFLF